MLTRIKKNLSDCRFKTDPDAIHGGDVGTLNHYAILLRKITESAFCEGEHAELHEADGRKVSALQFAQRGGCLVIISAAGQFLFGCKTFEAIKNVLRPFDDILDDLSHLSFHLIRLG